MNELLISISPHPTTKHGKYSFNNNLGRLWLSRLLGFVVGLQQIFRVPPRPPPPHQMMIASIESQYKPVERRELMMTEISHYTGPCQNSRYVSLQKHNQVKISKR